MKRFAGIRSLFYLLSLVCLVVVTLQSAYYFLLPVVDHWRPARRITMVPDEFALLFLAALLLLALSGRGWRSALLCGACGLWNLASALWILPPTLNSAWVTGPTLVLGLMGFYLGSDRQPLNRGYLAAAGIGVLLCWGSPGSLLPYSALYLSLVFSVLVSACEDLGRGRVGRLLLRILGLAKRLELRERVIPPWRFSLYSLFDSGIAFFSLYYMLLLGFVACGGSVRDDEFFIPLPLTAVFFGIMGLFASRTRKGKLSGLGVLLFLVGGYAGLSYLVPRSYRYEDIWIILCCVVVPVLTGFGVTSLFSEQSEQAGDLSLKAMTCFFMGLLPLVAQNEGFIRSRTSAPLMWACVLAGFLYLLRASMTCLVALSRRPAVPRCSEEVVLQL